MPELTPQFDVMSRTSRNPVLFNPVSRWPLLRTVQDPQDLHFFVDFVNGNVGERREDVLAGTFNVADDLPAPPQDVVTHAAAMIGITPPPEVAFDTAEMTPMARSFYSDNKRVSNARIKQALGIKLLYPTYREGLAAIHGEGR